MRMPVKKVILVLVLLLFSASAAYSKGYTVGVAGISLGTPGAINVHGGFYGRYFGIKGTLCLFNFIDALEEEDEDLNYENDEELFMFASQLNLELKVIEFDAFLLTLSILGGIFYENEEEESSHFMVYGGGAISIYLGKFYIEVGYAAISNRKAHFLGMDKTHSPLFQIGYMARFNGAEIEK